MVWVAEIGGTEDDFKTYWETLDQATRDVNYPRFDFCGARMPEFFSIQVFTQMSKEKALVCLTNAAVRQCPHIHFNYLQNTRKK